MNGVGEAVRVLRQLMDALQDSEALGLSPDGAAQAALDEIALDMQLQLEIIDALTEGTIPG